MTRRRARLLVFVLAVASVPAHAGAQSLFSAAGLGLPNDPIDGRARSLGNVGIGLLGTGILPTDPAMAAGIVLPTAIFTMQPSWVDFDRPETGQASTFQTTRFPLIGVGYPLGGLGTVTLTFGSFLDQRFEATRTSVIELAESKTIATDVFTSEGGVSEVRLGFARPVSSTVAVGISVAHYNGSTRRTLTRNLDQVPVQGSLSPIRETGEFGFSGTAVTAGAGVNVGTVARVAASATWSSSLDAEPEGDSTGPTQTFDLPLQLRVGASAIVAPGLALTASLATASWDDTGDDLADADARSTVDVGFGLELARARLFGRSVPLRIGYRRTELPFEFSGGAVSESAFTGGLGIALREAGVLTLAGVDLAVERGERDDRAISESFWRATFTFRVAGF